MCGIGAIWFRESVNKKLLVDMIEATEKRGQDAFGIIRITPRPPVQTGTLGRVRHFTAQPSREPCSVVKYPYSFSMVNRNRANLLSDLDIQVGDIVIWNCRARPMTEKESSDAASIQPILYEDMGIAITHNGVVANENDSTMERRTPLDSEIFLHKYLEHGKDTKAAVEELVGGSAYIMYDYERDLLTVVRDYQPLAKAYIRGIGYMVMSDVDEFVPLLGQMDVAVWENFYFSDVNPFTINEIDINSGLINVIPFVPKFAHSLPPQDKQRAIVLASGGVDSSVAAVIAQEYLKMDVTLVHIASGHKSDGGETKAVKYLAEFLNCELKIIDMKWLGELGNSVLTDPNLPIPKGESRFNLKSTVCWTPARNMVMLSALVAIAEGVGAAVIYNGFTLEESGSYPDNSQDFFKKFNELSNFGTLMRPQVRMLEQNLMKPEIARIANYYGLDLTRLWSCDETPPNGEECGVCGACTLKQMSIDQSFSIDFNRMGDILRKVTP